MKYVATLNGKKYEVEIERVDEYRPLDRGAQAKRTGTDPRSSTGTEGSSGSGSSTGTEGSSGTGSGSSTGSSSVRRWTDSRSSDAR